jgi:hypothetical protein
VFQYDCIFVLQAGAQLLYRLTNIKMSGDSVSFSVDVGGKCRLVIQCNSRMACFLLRCLLDTRNVVEPRIVCVYLSNMVIFPYFRIVTVLSVK